MEHVNFVHFLHYLVPWKQFPNIFGLSVPFWLKFLRMQADTSKNKKSVIFCWHQNSRKLFHPKLNIWALRDIRTKVHKHWKNIKEDIERGKFTSPPSPASVHDAQPTCIIPISVSQEENVTNETFKNKNNRAVTFRCNYLFFLYCKTDVQRNY